MQKQRLSRISLYVMLFCNTLRPLCRSKLLDHFREFTARSTNRRLRSNRGLKTQLSLIWIKTSMRPRRKKHYENYQFTFVGGGPCRCFHNAWTRARCRNSQRFKERPASENRILQDLSWPVGAGFSWGLSYAASCGTATRVP